MSILRLRGFRADAQVMGAVRQVEVKDAEIRHGAYALVIEGLETIEEANAILNRLTVGLANVQLPESAIVPKAQQVDQPKAEKAASVKAKTKVSTDDFPGDLGHDGKGPERPQEAPAAATKAPDQPAPVNAAPTPVSAPKELDAVLGEVVVDKIKAAKKLGDIVAMLHSAGWSLERAVSVCESIKAEVPVLRTMPSIADRMGRAWAIFDGGMTAN